MREKKKLLTLLKVLGQDDVAVLAHRVHPCLLADSADVGVGNLIWGSSSFEEERERERERERDLSNSFVSGAHAREREKEKKNPTH